MDVKTRLTALRLIEKQKNKPECFESWGIEIKMTKKNHEENAEEKRNVQLCSY